MSRIVVEWYQDTATKAVSFGELWEGHVISIFNLVFDFFGILINQYTGILKAILHWIYLVKDGCLWIEII